MMKARIRPVAKTMCALFMASALGACASMRGGGGSENQSAASQDQKSSTDTMSGTTGSSSSSSATGMSTAQPTDAEIAHIVTTANTVDITSGQMAMEKSKNPQIKEFAKQMINDHKKTNQQVAQLAKQLGMEPKSSDTSRSLMSNGDAQVTELRKLWGDQFDKSYIGNEVSFHQQVLNTIDNTLMPNAQNPQLKAQLQKIRPNIQAHLDHAKSIQASLTTSGSTSGSSSDSTESGTSSDGSSDSSTGY